ATAANAPIRIAGLQEVFAGVVAAGGTAAGRSTGVAGLIIVAAGGATTVASTPGVGAGTLGEATGAAARSASANSCAVWKRSSARLASALRTTASSPGGNCTLTVESVSDSSLRTFWSVMATVGPAE